VALTVDEASVEYERAMRNVQPAGPGICDTCHQFVDPDYDRCYSCAFGSRVLDAVVPITYSEHLGQMHTALRTYKSSLPQNERFAAIRLTAILWRFIEGHEACIADAAGEERGFDIVTTVPSSSKQRDEEGKFRQIVDWCQPLADRHRRLLAPTGKVADGDRSFSVDRYEATAGVAESSVLLVDDTWTTGGHAQSAAWALKQAGAGPVAAVVIGRHFHSGYEVGDQTSGERFSAIPVPFDWDTCAVHHR
jgi:predicted amidophosphoribosyltransferase